MINQRVVVKVILVFLIVAGLTAMSVYVLPILLKSQLVSRIQQVTGRKASIANAQLALLPLRIQLQNFVLPESNGQPFASFDSLTITVNVGQSFKQSAFIIEQLDLIKPVVHIVEQKNGAFNFDDLLKLSTNESATSPLFPVTLNRATLSDGQLIWETAIRKETIQPIQLMVTNFSTLAQQTCHINLQLSVKSGGQLDWQAQATLNPLQSTGHIQVKHLKLASLLATTLPEPTNFSLNGESSLNSDYQLSYQNNQFSLKADKTDIELRDFQYAEKAQNAMVVKAAQFNHDSDINLSYHNNTWQLNSQKARLSLRDFEFSGTPDNLSIKLASLTHETDVNAQFTDNHWQLSAKHSKLDGQNIAFNYANALFKAAKLSLETGIDSQFAKQEQVIVQQGNIHSQQLQLFGKDKNKPLLDIPNLALSGINFNLDQQNLSVASVRTEGANFRCDTDADYATLFATTPVKTEPKPAAIVANQTPWTIKVKQTVLAQCATTFVDQTQKTPVSVSINPINVKLTDYSNKTGEKLPFQFDAVINKTGSIRLNGDTIIEPFSTQLMLTAKAIDLEPFQPYLEKLARLDIIDGKLAGTGKLNLAMPENAPLDLKFTGDSSISHFVTRDQKRHKDFITWEKLSLNALNIDLQKDRYTANTLIIDRPYAKVTIKKDKTLNFADVFITQKPDSDPHPKQHQNHVQRQPYFKLDKFQIIDGSSDFADRSLILPFAAQIKSLDGGANDISSEQKSTIKVSLKGNAYDLAPVDVSGQISPYQGDFDLAVNFSGMPMPLISPYMVQFAGYKVEKGKMSLKLKYKVIANELDANNNILIDQFELGEKVDNPKAVSLPLEMAVALLKDADGKIKMDVPVTGSLDDPQFDIGAIIADALTNAISKVITSPFDALASLVGSEEAELSNIHFSAGKAVLDSTEQQKLNTIAKLLKERPVLVLNIKGTAFQNQDWSALKDDALLDVLKKMRADEINKQGSKKILSEYVELSNTDYQRLLAQLFIEKFPNLAKRSVFGTPKLIDTKVGDFYDVAKQQLSASLKREQLRLKELASQRARAIASFLVQKNNVPTEQIFILDPAVDPKRADNDIASILSLQTK